MKTIILAWICFWPWVGMAQTDKEPLLSPMLESYYQLKDALVSSDAKTAAAQATLFIKRTKGIEVKSLPAPTAKVFSKVSASMVEQATAIMLSQDVEKQRKYFSALSDDMYDLVQSGGVSTSVVYRLYCPMKKQHWLSKESAVKNPYYGQKMLTCGKVVEEIKAR